MPAEFFEELAWGKKFERIIAESFAQKMWPGSLTIGNQDQADADFTVAGSQVGELRHLAFLEIKARRVASTDFDSTMVVRRKWDLGRYAKVFFQVPTYCVILFTDTVASFDLGTPPNKREQVERRDRGTTEEHCFWDHSRLEWHPDLFAGIVARAGQGTGE